MATANVEGREALSMPLSSWSEGIEHELIFWKAWLSQRGGQYGWDFEARLRANRPVTGPLADAIKDRKDILRILDVGAGPMSVVGNEVGGRRLLVSATDPLAEAYETLAQVAGVSPPVRTSFSTAEDLSLFYDSNSFDAAYCQNALDHSFAPVRAITEMLRVVRVGGLVILNHAENEAVNEQYVGFHQFNFTENAGRFIIWNKSDEIDVGRSLPINADVHAYRSNDKIIVVISKNSEFPDNENASRHRKRAAEIIQDVVRFYTQQALLKVAKREN